MASGKASPLASCSGASRGPLGFPLRSMLGPKTLCGPNCGMRMTDREMARLKMHLYLLWTQIYNDHCGALVELFDYDIDLHPHTEEDNEAKTEV